MNEVIDEEIIKKNVFLNIMTKMPENIIENAKETFKNLSKGTNMLTLKQLIKGINQLQLLGYNILNQRDARQLFDNVYFNNPEYMDYKLDLEHKLFEIIRQIKKNKDQKMDYKEFLDIILTVHEDEKPDVPDNKEIQKEQNDLTESLAEFIFHNLSVNKKGQKWIGPR